MDANRALSGPQNSTGVCFVCGSDCVPLGTAVRWCETCLEAFLESPLGLYKWLAERRA